MSKILIAGAGGAPSEGVINSLLRGRKAETVMGMGSEPTDLVLSQASEAHHRAMDFPVEEFGRDDLDDVEPGQLLGMKELGRDIAQPYLRAAVAGLGTEERNVAGKARRCHSRMPDDDLVAERPKGWRKLLMNPTQFAEKEDFHGSAGASGCECLLRAGTPAT